MTFEHVADAAVVEPDLAAGCDDLCETGCGRRGFGLQSARPARSFGIFPAGVRLVFLWKIDLDESAQGTGAAEIVIGGRPSQAGEDQGIAGSGVLEQELRRRTIGLADGRLCIDHIIAMGHLAYDSEPEQWEAQEWQQNPREQV